MPTDSSRSQSAFYEYILTAEEEKMVIANELRRLIYRETVKLNNYGHTKATVEFKLSCIDFKSLIDEFDLLSKANVRKQWEIEQINMRISRKNKENNIFEGIKEKCTANYFFKLMLQSFHREGKTFIQDEYSNPYIKIICFFMSMDSRFESELNLSLKKGLWIVGPPGIGKTKLIDAVSQNELIPIKIVSMLDIADSVSSNGEYVLDWENKKKVLFDDAGSEQATVMYYGTKINWLKNFIELYYAGAKDFSKLIVTTNDDFDSIEEKYGYRVRSRIREMFNVVVVDGEDRRK